MADGKKPICDGTRELLSGVGANRPGGYSDFGLRVSFGFRASGFGFIIGAAAYSGQTDIIAS
jgi:hypothetical protein